jgi:hypothetical protein
MAIVSSLLGLPALLLMKYIDTLVCASLFLRPGSSAGEWFAVRLDSINRDKGIRLNNLRIKIWVWEIAGSMPNSWLSAGPHRYRLMTTGFLTNILSTKRKIFLTPGE